MHTATRLERTHTSCWFGGVGSTAAGRKRSVAPPSQPRPHTRSTLRLRSQLDHLRAVTGPTDHATSGAGHGVLLWLRLNAVPYNYPIGLSECVRLSGYATLDRPDLLAKWRIDIPLPLILDGGRESRCLSLRADFLTPVLAFSAPARPWNWI